VLCALNIVSMSTNLHVRALYSFVCIGVVVLLGLNPFPAQARTISDGELVDVFVIYMILSANQVEDVRLLRQGEAQDLSQKEFVELLISRGYIDADQATDARDLLRTILESPSKGVEGDVVVGPRTTSARKLRGVLVERGYFSVSYTVTAGDQALYIPIAQDLSMSRPTGFLEGGRHAGALGPAAEQQRVRLQSNAPRDGDAYRVDAGTTRQFTLINVFTPRDLGTWAYWYECAYVHYRTEPEGELYWYMVPSRELYRTDSITLTVRDKEDLRQNVRARIAAYRDAIAERRAASHRAWHVRSQR